MKTLIFVRTHFIDDTILSEFKKLQNSLNQNEYAILFINNEHNVIKGEFREKNINLEINDNFIINTLLYDKQSHDKLGLPYYTTIDSLNNKLDSQYYTTTDSLIDNIMWACCDYPFYAVHKEFPDYDFYWSLDYDVYCNGNSYRVFFDKYQTDADLIIHDYREIVDEPEWEWQYYSDWIYENSKKYGGFFPVVRLSNKAVKFLYKKRLEHAKIFENVKQDTNNKWLYGELFVPTELSNNGFSCQNLDTECLRFTPVYNLNRERIFEHPDFKLYHPVK